MADKPDQETSSEDVQPPTTATQEWARESDKLSEHPIIGSGGKDDGGGLPPSTSDTETRDDD